MLGTCEVNRHWTLVVVVTDVGSVFSNPCFQASGRLHDVGQPTGKSEHINHIINIAGYQALNVQTFPCERVIECFCFGGEIALGWAEWCALTKRSS